MIVVHHLEKSRSQRVLWLLEELGLEYEVRRYARDPATLLAPPELRAVHPLGKSPVIEDGTLRLAESAAILEYLVERHGGGRLIPREGTDERLRYRYWMHYAEGSLMPPLFLKLVLSRVEKAPAPFFARPIIRKVVGRVNESYILPEAKRHLDYLEAELGRAAWFAGNEFTAADVQMSYPLEAVAARAGFGGRAKLADFLERAQARPAYQRAMERGGPFAVVS